MPGQVNLYNIQITFSTCPILYLRVELILEESAGLIKTVSIVEVDQ